MPANSAKIAGRVCAILAPILLCLSFILAYSFAEDFGTLPPLLGGNKSSLIASGTLGERSVEVFSTLAVVPADGESEAEITVALKDAQGKPVTGTWLSLSLAEGEGFLIPISPITDDNGLATFIYRAGRVAITNVIDLRVPHSGEGFEFILPTSLSAVLTIELVDPLEYQRERLTSALREDVFDLEVFASPDVLVADGISLSTLTARLTFKDGRPAAGFPISFRVASGYGKVIQEQKLTNAEGQIQAFFQASDRVGTVLIEALELSTGKRAFVEITVLRAGPAKLKLFFGEGTLTTSENTAVLPADGSSKVEIVAQVLSLADTPVSGVKVSFKLKNHLGRIEKFREETDASGEVRAFFVAGAFSGIEELTAYVVSPLPTD